MAVSSTKPNSQANIQDTQPLPKKQRTKSPGVRIIGGRIYDSQNGKTCHQCRQKTMDFMAPCKNQGEKKQCSFRFCHKCLLNRYGEKAEEAVMLDEWKCPKCRGICNCSFCMKKRGHRPTGILVHTAKATGFSSVSEMLQFKGSENSGSERSVPDEGTSLTASSEELVVALSGCREKNGSDGRDDSRVQSRPLQMNGSAKETRNRKSCPNKPRISKEVSKKEGKIHKRVQFNKLNADMGFPNKTSAESIEIEDNEATAPSYANIDGRKTKHKPVKKSYRCKRNTLEVQGKDSHVEILLPQGTQLSSVASIDMLAEDVGHALQFLEFCEAFGQVLDLKKGQPELLLRELVCGQNKLQRLAPSVVRFHVQLLSMIQKNSENNYPSLYPTRRGNSWLKALSRCISESRFPPRELQLDCVDMDGDGYNKLNSSKKLRLLNFLCDEALGTVELRNWIDVQSSNFIEREKKEKGKCSALEKSMKKRLQDEMTKALLMKNGAPLSISEYDDLVSKIKTEVAQTFAETVEATDPKKKQRSDAVRSEPIFVDGNGRKFWRSSCCSSDVDILLQDVGNSDPATYEEKWFTYHVEQKATVESYISSLRSGKCFNSHKSAFHLNHISSFLRPAKMFWFMLQTCFLFFLSWNLLE
ncbi:uncharacterized protein LOC117904943 isoform X2 [Vitis riparia]|uniref:uncharacterized protein LOC117904943 isoform X2 n=1 Tax=Vitis riparia TaxID=96939 RepID=UPI00155A2C40|nr:uncharacterized protein LOC117904943 isoform X2 [Vitis riparia]